MKKQVWVASVFVTLLSASSLAQSGPDGDPDIAPGYTNNIFHHSQVDSINLYNGQLTIPIAIGPSYSVGPNLRFQALLSYNSKREEYGKPAIHDQNYIYKPLIGDPAVGIGWNFHFGAIKRCKIGSDPVSNCYVSPDGGSHYFGPEAGGFSKTMDGTRFYLQNLGAGGFQMWDGDGNLYTFSHQVKDYNDPIFVPTYNYTHDFGNGRDGWYLRKVKDPFGNSYDVNYRPDNTAPCWTYAASTCPALLKMSCPSPPPTRKSWIPESIVLPGGTIYVGLDTSTKMIPWVDFPVFANGSATTARWSIDYLTEDYIRTCSGGSTTWTVNLRKISAVRLPSVPGSPSYQFLYSQGYLNQMRLPTGATIDYQYKTYTFFHGRIGAWPPLCSGMAPIADIQIRASCAPACTPAPPAVAESSPDFNCTADLQTRWMDEQLGVSRRTETVAGVPSVTDYTQYSYPYGERQTSGSPVAEKHSQSLTVVLSPPDIDGKRRARGTLFWTSHPVQANDVPKAGDRFGAAIEERVFDGDPNPNLGSMTIPQPACPNQPFCPNNAVRVSKTEYEYDTPASQVGNRRLKWEETFFSPTQLDGSCGSCPSHKVEFFLTSSTWEGNGRHYNLEKHTGTLANVNREIETTWDPKTSPLWLPNLYTLRVEREPGATGITTTEKRFEFDPANGFLLGVSNWDDARDLLYLNCRYSSGGNVGAEFGARYFPITAAPPVNLCGLTFPSMPPSIGVNDDNWGKSYTYNDVNKLLESATWISAGVPIASWQIFRHDRDEATGWILSTTVLSADTDMLGAETTSYQYDSLGRVTSIAPPGEAATVVTYTSPNQTKAERNGGTGPLGTFEEYFFDGLGRKIKQRRLMADGTYAKVFSLFDKAGNEYFSSEWVADTQAETVTANLPTTCSFSTGAFSTLRPQLAPGTYRHCVDPFGRPQDIVGSRHSSRMTLSRVDGSSFYSDTLESLTTECVNGTFSNGNCGGGSPSTTTTRRDAAGRVTLVGEPGGVDSTSYLFDVNGNITRVTQGVQQRLFGYDTAGFLRSEVTPEKGTVTYDDVTATGSTLQETQGGGVILTRTYDFAGRVELARANGILYGQSSYDGAGFAGGTRPKGKLTQRIGYNPVAPGNPAVTESFSYSGIGGRPSQKDVTLTGTPQSLGTVTETWGYNTLGLQSTHTLPRRAADTVVTATTEYLNGFPSALKISGAADAVKAVTYHPHGGIKTWTAGNNLVTTNAADASLLPRPGSISGSTFSSGAYSYDGAGNIRSIGSNAFTYDSRSRLFTSVVSGTPMRTYIYDRYGNDNSVYAVSTATNRLSAGTYDLRGNLTTLGTQRYDYDALSRQTAFNGGVERYVYDGSGERIARVTAPNAPNAGADLFTLFPCRLFDTRSPPPVGGSPLAAGESRTYTVTGQCGVPSDAVGVTGNLVSLTPPVAGFFKLVPTGTNPSVSTLNYAAGKTLANNVRLPLSGNGQATLSTSAGTHALLDLTGYYKLLAPTWTVTFRDEANRLSTEYTVDSSVITRTKNYFHFGSLLVGLRQPSGLIWSFVSDHLGTPRRVFNNVGGQVETHDYQPFGQEIAGSFGNQPMKFAAMERDASSTKDYVHARYFGSLEGRFLGPDKLHGRVTDPQTWNRYTYARNNPLKFVDRTGLDFALSSCGHNPASAECGQDKRRLQKWVGEKAYGYLKVGKGGLVTYDGITAAGFAALGTLHRGLAALIGSRKTFTLFTNNPGKAGPSGGFSEGVKGGGANIFINPAKFPRTTGDVQGTMATAFVHETGHALGTLFPALAEQLNNNPRNSPFVVQRNEAYPVNFENRYRREVGLDVRAAYLDNAPFQDVYLDFSTELVPTIDPD